VHVAAIIAAGGRGLRLGHARPKQLLTVGGVPMLQRSVDAFAACDLVDSLVVALPEELLVDPPEYLRVIPKPTRLVAGGARRRDSVAAAVAATDASADVIVIHDAARPLVSDALIRRTVAAAAQDGAAIAALQAHDTVKQIDEGTRTVAATLRRESIVLAQTPQAFRADVLRAALAADGDATDEAVLVEQAGHRVRVVEGDPRNLKITTADDLALAETLLAPQASSSFRIGNGYDLHTLVEGRPLILGGVAIPFDRGLLGHSDADVVCHAVTDAILGAAGAGDIGRHFPDTDPAWKDANSLDLLRRAAAAVRAQGFGVVNVDVTVIAQRPRISPHVEAMRASLAAALGCAPADVSVKGKTNEGVDAVGAGQAIAAHAVALLARH
jgi:2-C-methyl-D-erythritol 4-phosphate cytidylyltransferase/2-C-methyl-D-erythritol 2,4-cyclodiphosphate synthase